MDKERLKEEIKKKLKEKYSYLDEYELEALAEELSKYDNILEKLENDDVFNEEEAGELYWDRIMDILSEQINETLHEILQDEIESGELIKIEFGNFEFYIRVK